MSAVGCWIVVSAGKVKAELTQQKLNKHIEGEFNGVKFNPTIAYSTIFDEIKRRNNTKK